MNRFDDPNVRAMLRAVQKPARYTGHELNAIDKSDSFFQLEDSARVHFALCFPDLYEIGMSNLAIQILYGILNEDEHTFCERVFAPDFDMRQLLKEKNMPLTSLETGTALSDFDMVGISLHYEMAYTTMLEMLALGGVPLESSKRQEDDPIVVGGGPIACNLEPVADFFDFIVIGDGEEIILEIVGALKEKKKNKLSRRAFLLSIADIPGVYIPSFYAIDYKENGQVERIRTLEEKAPEKLTKRLLRDINEAPMPQKPIVPNLEVVHDRMVMEVLRGCARGCRFCQAGFTYRPLRERTVETLLETADSLIEHTGYEEMGLLSLSTSDYSQLEPLVRKLLPKTEPRHINLSLPSLRLDSFDFDLAKEIAKTRRAGLTFAPEAGTQRLRDVINKNITEEEMMEAARTAFLNGWDRLKLYFMLGLPTETEDDVEGIVTLVRKFIAIWDNLPQDQRSKRLNVTVSAAFFIPKPFTPFQWSEQISVDAMREKQKQLADSLRDRRVSFSWHEYHSSIIEGVLSRGDRRLKEVLLHVWRSGAYLEAWHEHFDAAPWYGALSKLPGGGAFYLKAREEQENFPWDHLDLGVTKAFLWREWKKSQEGKTTPSCYDGCSACGNERYRTGVCPGSEWGFGGSRA